MTKLNFITNRIEDTKGVIRNRKLGKDR